MKGLDLRLARVGMRLNQYELAHRLDIHAPRISEMERDQRPIPEWIAKRIHEMEASALASA